MRSVRVEWGYRLVPVGRKPASQLLQDIRNSIADLDVGQSPLWLAVHRSPPLPLKLRCWDPCRNSRCAV